MRVDYPNLFRIDYPDDARLTHARIEQLLIAHLDTVSSQINQNILDGAPLPYDAVSTRYGTGTTFTELEWDLINLLTDNRLGTYDSLDGSYPTPTIDLTQFLQAQSDVWTILIDALYWKHLDNAAPKYAYVIENYLSAQEDTPENIGRFPSAKNEYEIAYI